MTTTKEGQSGGKGRQRSRKPDRRGQKAAQPRDAKFDSQDEDRPGATVASTDTLANEAVELAQTPLIGEVIPPDAPSGTARPVAGFPAGIQAIAEAYGDYARQSLQANRSFVERLMGVRSFDEAIGVQAEFAKLAYANFVAESQKICELYSELARQIFRPWGSFTASITHPSRLKA
jgi:hypothetical protein